MSEDNNMMMTQAVLRSGLISVDQLAEMKRFRPPSLSADADVEEFHSLEEAAQLVSNALQSEGYVLMRETDLEGVSRYMATSTPGKLHMELDTGEVADIDVSYGRTQVGEFLIAWRSESIKDSLTNGLTYLVDGDRHVFFKDVRELFFGEQKVFMVCVPSVVEHAQS